MRSVDVLLLSASLFLSSGRLVANAQTAEERTPRLVPWAAATNNAAGRFFSGVVSPETSDNGMVFRLDAVLTTPHGANYYGLGLRLRTLQPATFQIKLESPGKPAIDVKLVGVTSCTNVAPGAPQAAQLVMLGLGAREGLRQTGRASPGAPPGAAQLEIEAGHPIFMYECESNQSNISERRIRVLIPEAALQSGGRLSIIGLYPAPHALPPNGLPCLVNCEPPPPISSAPLNLNLRRGGPRVLVVGDSVAWGQGVGSGLTAGFRVFSDMVQRYGGGVTFTNRAHSGAIINEPEYNRIDQVPAANCLTDRDLHGEIPRSDPTIQCQVKDASTRECFVPTGEIGLTPLPFFFCVEGLPLRPSLPGETRFDFDLGPTYDLVVLWGCINDVNAFDIVTGLVSAPDLAQRTSRECDLRHGLEDIRAWLPNAKVIVNEYQQIVSNLSKLDRSGCSLQSGLAIFAGLAGGAGTAAVAFFSTDAAIAAAGARANSFRSGATSALSAAVTALNATAAATDQPGRGSLEFLDHPFFDPPASAIWANDPLVFPLVCDASGTFAATDTERSARVSACARWANTSATDPFRIADPNFMKCVRASGFHPDVRANNFVATRIIEQLRRFYPRMLNFKTPASMVNSDGPLP